MYAIVRFEESEDYSVILSKWLMGENPSKTYFPPKKQYLKLPSLLKKKNDADTENWNSYECEILLKDGKKLSRNVSLEY